MDRAGFLHDRPAVRRRGRVDVSDRVTGPDVNHVVAGGKPGQEQRRSASREIARGIELALERRAGLARGEGERRGRLGGHRRRVGSDRRHRAHRVYRPHVGLRHRLQVAELIAGAHGQGVAPVREAG